MLLPATPGWVSLPVVVGGPRHSWLRSPGGGGVWWGCGWCVVWLVPRHSWRRFLCATPRHFWLGFAAGGGVQFPATPGWGLLAAVVRGVWCVVCGVWCAAVVCWRGCGWCVVLLVPRHSWRRFLCATPRHSWLGFAAGGGGRSSPLLAEGPGRGSPPLLAGVRWRRCVAWSVPRHSWQRFLRATPRHSWLGFGADGGVWSPASPGWGLLAAVVCGVWCVVCGVWCVVCGVWCVVCGGGVLVGLRLVCGVVGSSPLPAEVPVCYSPPLLAGFRCRRWWALLATPAGGSRSRFPATPGWVSLSAVVCGVWCVVCGVWRAAVACVVGLWLVCGVVGPSPLVAEVPVCYSPPLLAGFCCRCWFGAPRHSWLGPAGCGGVFRGPGCPLLCVFVVCMGVRGGRAVLCVACLWCPCFWWCGVVVRWVCLPGALLLGPGVCVCAVWPFVLVWVAWGGRGLCAVWLSCVRVCVLAVCGWWGGVCHTLAGSRRRSSAWFKKQKKRPCRCVAEMRGMRDA